jgi:hypothetical protein
LRMHCFVLLGVSSIQLKNNRVATQQCALTSEFRLHAPQPSHQRLFVSFIPLQTTSFSSDKL